MGIFPFLSAFPVEQICNLFRNDADVEQNKRKIHFMGSEKKKGFQENNSVSYKRSLVAGMLLGRASSRVIKGENGKLMAEFTVWHSLEQADLIYWKAEEINRLFNTDVVISINYIHNEAGFSIIRGRRIRVIHKWFHRNGKKTVTDKIRFMDHPVGMAMLLCDKGSIKEHRNQTGECLSPCITVAFSESDIERLLNHIKNRCGAVGCSAPECQQISFDAENTKIFWEYVQPWMPGVQSVADKFSSLGSAKECRAAAVTA